MKMTKWQCPVADVGGITDMIIRTFLASPWAPFFCAFGEDRCIHIEVHSYREEGTALVANIGVTTHFGGLSTTKMGRVYL